MAAAALKTPELELDDSEAATLAGSISEVASYYGATVDPKIMAWIGLAGTVGAIYGTRIAAIRIRKAGERPPQHFVTPVPGAQMGGPGAAPTGATANANAQNTGAAQPFVSVADMVSVPGMH